MIEAKNFIEQAEKCQFKLYTGVPCSYLKPFINYVIDSENLNYISAANEGDAVAIASGAALAGQRSVVMFQNSGFGNTVNPLSSLNAISKIPILVITTLRGEPGGPADEPQHDLMGRMTAGLFELMDIPWEYFPEEDSQIAEVLERALSHMNQKSTPYGLIMRKGAVAPYPLQSKPIVKPFAEKSFISKKWSNEVQRPTRKEVLSVLQKRAKSSDVLLATTGFTGRALYALEDKPNQFYMVGSMGCISSLGLGVAWAQPKRRVYAIDGDGAFLMRMGSLSTVGYERPGNLVHILLDNEVHGSTGGQSTVSHSMDLAQVAHACGYPRVEQVESLAELESVLNEIELSAHPELCFIQVKTVTKETKEDTDGLPRPKVTPEEVTQRLQKQMSVPC